MTSLMNSFFMIYNLQNHQTFLIIIILLLLNTIAFVIILLSFQLFYLLKLHFIVHFQQALYEHFLTPLHRNLITFSFYQSFGDEFHLYCREYCLVVRDVKDYYFGCYFDYNFQDSINFNYSIPPLTCHQQHNSNSTISKNLIQNHNIQMRQDFIKCFKITTISFMAII